MSGVGQAVFMNQRSFVIVTGQEAFVTSGTFSWVAPAGVTKVSAVAVGGGANSSKGSGGGLGYKNNYDVTPGNSYTVVVGAGGFNSACLCQQNGQNSNFISTAVLKGGGGTASGGTFTGTGGGNGGVGGTQGGSGAGGYSGTGGIGHSGFGGSGTAGTGGAGGGGGGGFLCCVGFNSGGGGGVGILGEGASGSGGIWTGSEGTGGGGGSGGSQGRSGFGGGGTGKYGGGGAFSLCGQNPGAIGAVRIIWPGCARSFPSTRTADE